MTLIDKRAWTVRVPITQAMTDLDARAERVRLIAAAIAAQMPPFRG